MTANSQAYPARQVRLILPFSPGGPGSLVADLLRNKLADRWPHPLLIDTRRQDGLQVAAKSPPDGYTFVMVAGSYYINASLCRTLPYDPVGDFIPVSLLASIFNVLVVHPSIPVRTVRELIEYGRSHPGKLAYASSGYGSAPHLAGELFRILAGVDITHVAYKGHIAGAHALAKGQEVQFMFDAMSTALPHIQAGEVRALGVTTSMRAANLPDVPTIAEAGLPGFEVSPTLGLLAPVQTPRAIVEQVSSVIAEVMHVPDVAALVIAAGMRPVGRTPGEFGTYMKETFARCARLIHEARMEML